jgi:ABC-type antimicrobial peptide transport system permease subunit
MEVVKHAWEEIAPGSVFQGSFLDENTDRQYKQEGRLSRIFISAAVLAILIACMGLFAIAVMAMAQRTREIGIRKVLGASVQHLVLLLSADFLKLVVLSILLAVPLAWFGMNHWLADYAYRIHIQGWTFLLVAVIAVGIAFCTVSFNAIRTALTNPVKSLRSLD